MFEIIVDSAANIPAELCKKYKIKVLSFVNLVNGKEMTCFEPDLTPEQERAKGKEYYDAIREGAEVKTGLISSGIFEDTFREIIEADKDILYFSLSKNISGNYNSARVAADAVLDDCNNGRKIRLVDSLETYPARLNGVFTVGNLKYIARTGRLSGTTALVGNMLSIKPILRGSKDGYIVQFRKCRGRKAVLNELVNLLCDNITDPENQIIGVAHADAYEDSLYVIEQIKKRMISGSLFTSFIHHPHIKKSQNSLIKRILRLLISINCNFYLILSCSFLAF